MVLGKFTIGNKQWLDLQWLLQKAWHQPQRMYLSVIG
jgi:hypothetical protein